MKQSNSFKSIKSSDLDINKSNHIDRGFELILRGGKRKPKKSINIILNRVVRLFKREYTIHFEFSIRSKKIKSSRRFPNDYRHHLIHDSPCVSLISTHRTCNWMGIKRIYDELSGSTKTTSRNV